MCDKPTHEKLEQREQALDKAGSQTRLTEEELTMRIQEWQNTFDNVSDAIFILHRDQRVLRANRTAEEFFQLPIAEMIGKQCWEIVHGTKDPIKDCPSLRAQNSHTWEKLEFQLGNRCFHVTVDPMLDDSGRYTGAVHIVSDVTERKQVENALLESEQKLRILAQNPIVGRYISQDNKLIFVNDRLAEMHGYSKKEIIGQPDHILIHPKERTTFRSRMNKRLTTGETFKQRFQMLRIRKNGEPFWAASIVTAEQYNGKPVIIASVVDISETKRAEKELTDARDELELRVQERTEELRKANDALHEKTTHLEDVNTALKVLLDKREKDKFDLGEKVLLNVKEFLVPYVNKLKNGPLNENQRYYIELLESGLHDIISPFAQKLTSRYMHITPGELQVANLVKEGRTSKEIAEILNSTERAVVAHRTNLRKKLGLKNKTNLRTHLLSLH